MLRNVLFLLISAFFSVPALAQDVQSQCISTHFHHFYSPMDGVKNVSVERLKHWSIWCKNGYTAQNLDRAIQPCYQQQLSLLRSQNSKHITIDYQTRLQIKNQCAQQIWSSLKQPSNIKQPL